MKNTYSATIKFPRFPLSEKDREHFIELLLAASAEGKCPPNHGSKDVVDEYITCVKDDKDMSPKVKEQMEQFFKLVTREQLRSLLQ